MSWLCRCRLRTFLHASVCVVPAERSGALCQEMALLRRTIDRGFADPEDRILAGVGDLQGFGGRPCTGDPGRP